MPSGVVPAIAVTSVPIEFLLTRDGGDFASHPSLGWQLGTLSEHECCIRLYRRILDRYTQTVGIGDGEHVRLILERLQLPSLVIAAATISHGNRIAGARRLISLAADVTDTVSASRESGVAIVRKRLMGLTVAARNN